jgi:hypothetical protein
VVCPGILKSSKVDRQYIGAKSPVITGKGQVAFAVPGIADFNRPLGKQGRVEEDQVHKEQAVAYHLLFPEDKKF